MLKLKLQYFGHLIEELTHWKRPWCWERLKAEGEGNDREWDVWMASLTWWTWVWASSRGWWRTGKPDMQQSIGSQTVGHTGKLNWTVIIALEECLMQTQEKPSEVSLLHNQLHCLDDQIMVFPNSAPWKKSESVSYLFMSYSLWLPDSSVLGLLQARILKCISYTDIIKKKVFPIYMRRKKGKSENGAGWLEAGGGDSGHFICQDYLGASNKN